MNDTKTILVIEENLLIADILRTVLEAVGYSVHIVADADKARALVHPYPPSLVLLDLDMNVNQGVEFIQWAQERQKPSFPLVMMGHDDDTRRLARSMGVDNWLHMPFDIDKLIDLVNRLVP